MMLISTNSGLYSAREGKPRYRMADAMTFFSETGFEAVDVNFCATVYREEFRHECILDGDWKKNLDEVMDAAARGGLKIVHTHAPFPRPSSTGDPDYPTFVEMLFRSIEATAYIGAEYIVVHPLRDERGETSVDLTVQDLKPYADAAGNAGVTLAVENMASTDEYQLIEIADRLGSGICWDIGHANIKGLNQPEAIRRMGKRLKVLHLHDNYGEKDNHNAPYFGNINWKDIVAALEETAYQGVFNYEVSPRSIPEALYRELAAYLVKAAKDLLGRPL